MRFGRALIAIGSAALLAAPAAGWQLVTTQDGVEVRGREVPGRDLPVLQAVGEIEGGLDEVLAVIRDPESYTEWMHNCVESRVVRTEADVVYVYNRTYAPWPVADRDAVLRTEMSVIEPGREVHAFFRSVDEPAERGEGTVRMAKLEGHYKLRALSDGRTAVEYQIDADPGGSLPRWLARRTVEELPLRTVLNLRAQVARRRGR